MMTQFKSSPRNEVGLAADHLKTPPGTIGSRSAGRLAIARRTAS